MRRQSISGEVQVLAQEEPVTDPQIITAYAAGTASLLAALSSLLRELREWRRHRSGPTKS